MRAEKRGATCPALRGGNLVKPARGVKLNVLQLVLSRGTAGPY
jgi:hypothetical protein